MAKIPRPQRRDTKAEQKVWADWCRVFPMFKGPARWQTNDLLIGLDITAVRGSVLWLVCISPTFTVGEMVAYYTQTVRPLQYATAELTANGLVIADSPSEEAADYDTELDMYVFTRKPDGTFWRNGRARTDDGSIDWTRPIT